MVWPASLVLGTLALLGFLWFQGRRPKLTVHDLAQSGRAFIAVFGSFATTGLAIGGRYGLAAVTLIATIAAAKSLINAWRSTRPLDATGETTTSRTAYLEMRLDHDTGQIDGVVREGRYNGIVLSVLALTQLLDLRDEIRLVDADSLALLDTYLDFAHSHWREFAEETGATPLDEDSALEILGLDKEASVEEIKSAHRRLVAKVHPDHGGSSHLTAQVNAAKELLLRRRGS